jgi:hypothetical protein
MGATASIFLAPLQGLLNTFQSERHYRDDKIDEALLSIQKALIRSKQYAEASKGIKCYDRDKEFELSQLWADASVKARYASEDLAQRLHDKSLFWADKIEWSSNEVLDKGIDFDSIEQQIEKLLAKKP